MKQIIEFSTENGQPIFVEVNELVEDDRIALGDRVVQAAEQTLESALEGVKPLASTIMNKIQSLNEPADEVEVKFGIKMSAELGAVIASGNAEINYEITLKWNQGTVHKNAHTSWTFSR